jgi:hypothetical protein
MLAKGQLADDISCSRAAGAERTSHVIPVMMPPFTVIVPCPRPVCCR